MTTPAYRVITCFYCKQQLAQSVVYYNVRAAGELSSIDYCEADYSAHGMGDINTKLMSFGMVYVSQQLTPGES